jgi:uncharacterized protein YdaU (DUF1376 family)
MGRPWYSFYPADYGRDTGHLSLTEHGVYRVLMDHYYATETPLPADRARLRRLARAFAPEEEAALDYVLAAFFNAGAEGFRHKRIEQEIAKAIETSAKNSAAARIGVEKRQRKFSTEPARAPAQARPSPSPSPSQDENISHAREGFEEFWNAYPRQEARALARRAYARALESATPETLIAGARSYAARREGQDANFTRLPSTWLMQECWLDNAGSVSPPDEAALSRAWDGRAAALIADIGAAQFQAYFGEAGFDPGPPARVRVDAPFLKHLIERKFSGALRRAFGAFVLEVAE